MDDEKIYQVSLSMVPGIGDITAKILLSYCGSAKEIFKKNKNQLSKIPGIGLINADKIKSFSGFAKAETEIIKCQDHKVDVLFFTDENYPKKLKHAPDSPAVLYYRGSADLNNNKTVAIAGTKKSTSYGRQFTEKIISELAPHKALIVSGLAYGIDINAHKASLNHKQTLLE